MVRMSAAPENHLEPARVNDYDRLAEAYTAENDAGIDNAYYERPAVLALAGDVTGRRILDAGCGSGPLFAALRERGAVVSGLDSSAGMLEQARRRLGDDADLRLADLRDPLPFADDAFDDVIASLVLHYLEDWGPALSEIRRVLRTGGRLIVSVDHPMIVYVGHRLSGREVGYFGTRNSLEEWTMGGQTVPMSFWHRPLHAMTDAFTAAGFRLSVISERQPVPAARELFPDAFRSLSATPAFLFFVLEAG
ncbi:class I SAM-dependent methyltransferase [Nonomuraea typhae]|uniref:Class I SAM-dependent methyltransferase n=1 Tax=Nonomuraea typhae TaxID=2603600 RepID=A0ABW7Z9I4_9ACTN